MSPLKIVGNIDTYDFRLFAKPRHSRGDLHSLSMSSETFNPEPTQQETRECQQRKGNVTMSSTMQRQKDAGQLWAG